jgi:hypothetical protein
MFDVRELVKVSQFLPQSPHISSAENFQISLNKYPINELKGIASVLKIKLSHKTHFMLCLNITKVLYFCNNINNVVNSENYSVMDVLYHEYLDKCIAGNMNDASELLILRRQRFQNTINRETRLFNLDNLSRMGQVIQIGSSHFRTMLSTIIHGPDQIERIYGYSITIADIEERVPAMAVYLSRDERDNNLDVLIQELFQNDDDFEDVVKSQKLTIDCNYDDGFESTSECIICCDNIICNSKLNCDHEFCIECVNTSLDIVLGDHRKIACCPMCRTEIKSIDSNDAIKIAELSLKLN